MSEPYNPHEEHYRAVSNIHFYLREQFYGTAHLHAVGRIRAAKDPAVEVLIGACLILSGKLSEALRHLDTCTDEDYLLGVLYAKKWAHTSAVNPDTQSLIEIERNITSARRAENIPATSYASAADYYCMLGWADFEIGKHTNIQKFFEIASSQQFPDGYLGRCKVAEFRRETDMLRIVATEAATSCISFVPGFIEQCRAAITQREWARALEYLQNSNASEGSNPLIDFLALIQGLCHTVYNEKLVKLLDNFEKSLYESEPDNHQLMAKLVLSLISTSAKHKDVLILCRKIMSRVLKMARRPYYMSIALRIAMNLEDEKEVTSLAKELMVSEIDDPFGALALIISQLMNGRLADAKSQYAMIHDVHPNVTQNIMYHIIGAVLSKQEGGNFDDFRRLLQAGIDQQNEVLAKYNFGVEYITNMNCDLLYTVALHLINYGSFTPSKGNIVHLLMAQNILEMILSACPGLGHVRQSLARVKYLQSEFNAALDDIKKVLMKDDSFSEAYLLKAQILLDKEESIVEAESVLASAVTFNFSIRETSLFHLIQAKAFLAKKNDEEAIKTLRNALTIQPKAVSKNLLLPSIAGDPYKIYVQVELIKALQNSKRTADAEKLLQQASVEWSDKSERDQLVIAQADFLVLIGRPDQALKQLEMVKPTVPNFKAARMKMAEIYRNHMSDVRMYKKCYTEILENEESPSAATYAMMGDAFLASDDAIEYYEKAMKMQSKNFLLAQKVGEAYIKCHWYAKAMNFYESAMNNFKSFDMRIKLTELLIDLKKFDKAEKVLKQALTSDENSIDPQEIEQRVKYLTMLSVVYQNKDEITTALECLHKAKLHQMRLYNKGDNAYNINVKREAGKICNQLAVLYLREKSYPDAIEHFKEAVSMNEQDTKSNLQLAKLYMSQNKFQLCSNIGTTILHQERDNDEATLMMADLLYLKNEAEQAVIHFMQLLSRNPNHYHALARAIELSWRCGDIEHADKYLQRAADARHRATLEPGFNYCKGLNEWFAGDTSTAIHSFNRAKRDKDWGEQAIYYMIEICLLPGNQIGSEILDPGSNEKFKHVKTAENYLNEVRNKPLRGPKFEIMQNYILLNSNDKQTMTLAIQNLTALMGDKEPIENLGAAVYAAKGHIMMKQQPKAKQLLKKAVTSSYTLDNAEYLEKCWILLAEMYIQQNKMDQANKYLDIVLSHNASCIKAFECKGHIYEKDQKYSDAVRNYEAAWKFSKERDPGIGYKLAQIYFKQKKLFPCLDVCNKVLYQHPHYPRLKKDIMDKARNSLRT